MVEGMSDSREDEENVYEYATSPYPNLPAQTPGLLYGELGPAIQGETRQIAQPNESVYSEVLKVEHNMPIYQ